MQLPFNNLRKIAVFYRIKDWLHILGLILLGYAYSHPYQINFRSLAITLITGGLYLAHGYSLNDIFDRQIKTAVPPRQARSLTLSALILSLLGGLFISLEAFFIVAFGHLCGTLYSAVPFRLKNKPFLDLIFNSLSLAPLFLLGYTTEKNLTPEALWASLLFFTYFLSIQLIHQIQDYPSDLRSEQNNTVQAFGIKKATYLIFFFLVVYISMSALFWRWGVLKISSSVLSGLFAVTLIFYLWIRKPEQILLNNTGAVNPVRPWPNGVNFKLSARYISIAYGIGMLATFYLDI